MTELLATEALTALAFKSDKNKMEISEIEKQK